MMLKARFGIAYALFVANRRLTAVIDRPLVRPNQWEDQR